jgi:hypothetical protein
MDGSPVETNHGESPWLSFTSRIEVVGFEPLMQLNTCNIHGDTVQLSR